MKGLNKDHVDFISDQVIKLKGERVYKFTRERIKWHHKQGHKDIFISGSPDFLVSKMAKKYGATDYCGSKYLVDHNNAFTGEVIPMWDANSKQEAIAKYVEKYDLDLSESFAYGDTHGDVTMFKAVGHPIAINPARELLMDIKNNEELKKKTVIALERKDVVYKLTGDVEIFE